MIQEMKSQVDGIRKKTGGKMRYGFKQIIRSKEVIQLENTEDLESQEIRIILRYKELLFAVNSKLMIGNEMTYEIMLPDWN